MGNQNNLIIIMIILLGFGVGYFYYSQWVVPTLNPIEPSILEGRTDLKEFENVKIDFSILDNQKYKLLETYGENPVNPGTTGKKDLFAPI